MKKLMAYSSVCLLAVFLVACGRLVMQPIMNFTNQQIPGHLSNKQIARAIKIAVNYKRWRITKSRPGVIYANIMVRRHFASIKIPYTKHHYSIEYVNSRNLKANAKGYIHRNYNKWVILLNNKIQSELNLFDS